VSDVSTSSAVAARLAALRHEGVLSEADARAHSGALIITEHGAASASDHIRLHLVVGPDGLVKAVRFASPAQGDLRAAYDAMAELCVGRKLSELTAITPRLVEGHLRGPASTEPAFALTLEADQPFYVLQKAAERAPGGAVGVKPAVPFTDCGLFEKVKRIEAVLDLYVRPALASDGGGLDLVDLRSDELHVQYHGACGSCSSSVGGTLQFVQDSLNNHLVANLVVKVTSIDEELPFGLGG
jgi:NifU-like protein